MTTEKLLTHFARALQGRAAYQRRSLVVWAREALEDSSLIATPALSPEAQLRFVLDLAEQQNRKLNDLYNKG